MSDRATLVQIYIAFYNRAPDPEGLDFWQGACDAGLSLSEIAELFVPQDESIGTYPFLGNPTEEGIRSFLQSVYENLFNREIDAAGETFWTNQILKSLSGEPGGLSIGEVVLSIITGAQGDDITTLANKTEVALDFHDQAAALDDYMQNPAATTASRLALSVVDETDFSVVQGKVLNENYFEEFDGQGNPLFDPFMPGIFDPIVTPGQTPLDEAPVNGLLLGNQLSSDVAVLTDGKVVTAYTITADGPNYVAFNIRNADGSLSLPDGQLLTIAERAAGDIVNDPVVVALPEGGFIVVVRAFLSGQEGSIVAYRYDATGQQIGDPAEIVEPLTLESIDSFDVAYLPPGNLLLTVAGDQVLDNDFGGPHDTFQMLVDLEGVPITDLEIVNDNDNGPTDEDEPRAAGLPDGTTLVVYQTDDGSIDGDDDAVVGQLYDAQGDAIGGPIVINQNTNSSQRDPAVAALGEDRFIVVFETFSNVIDIQSGGISGVILNSDGSVDVDEFGINQRILGQQFSPDVAELGNGNFVVVWRDSANTGDIRARIFEDDGTIVTDDIAVNDLTPGSQSRPSVAATADGFVVTWDTNQTSLDDPFDTFSVRMAAFDEDGARLPLPAQVNPTLPLLTAQEFQVNDEIVDLQQEAKVVGLPDSSAVFSYHDGETNQTFYELRGPDGLPRGPEMMAFDGLSTFSSGIDMARTPEGGFVMVGEGQTVGGPGILMQIFDANLTPGPVLKINEEAAAGESGPAVAVDGDGNIVVGWTFDDNINPRTVVLRKFDSDGAALTGEVVAGSALSTSGLRLSDLAINDSGEVIVLSDGDDVDGIGTFADVHVSLLDGDLVRSFSGALDSASGGTQQNAKAVALDDGNFMVVFTDVASPGGAPGFDISRVIIDSDGEAVGDTFLINTTTAGGQVEPDIIRLDDGRILVSWAGPNPGFNQDVFARLFFGDGIPIGPDFALNTEQELNEGSPALAATGNGFAATWESVGLMVGDEPVIKGAVFDANLDPVTVPRILPNNDETLISFDDLLEMQDVPLDGGGLFITDVSDTSLGADMETPPFPGFVRYDPTGAGGALQNLDPGETLTDIFTYTVEDADGDQVTLVGSFQVQGFEDVM